MTKIKNNVKTHKEDKVSLDKKNLVISSGKNYGGIVTIFDTLFLKNSDTIDSATYSFDNKSNLNEKRLYKNRSGQRT